MYTRTELVEAFEAYEAAGRLAGETGDWATWADHFTEDAVYVEHLFGRFEGREAIRDWISTTMTEFPNSAFTSFPIGWAVFDEARGWVVCEVWNRLADPGDGTVFEAANFTKLVYAGDGRWSYEEDVYNPQTMADAVQGWLAHRRALKEQT